MVRVVMFENQDITEVQDETAELFRSEYRNKVNTEIISEYRKK